MPGLVLGAKDKTCCEDIQNLNWGFWNTNKRTDVNTVITTDKD